MTDPHHPPEGLRADLPFLMRRRKAILGGGALALGGVLALRGGEAATATAADGTTCISMPVETAGPFPADGTNVRNGQTVNILTEAGVQREDIRTSIGGLQPVAEGVPMTLTINLVDVGQACAPLAGRAIYLWQCDAAGVYSIYDAADRNYLRGVGVADASGQLRFTTVFPGCYPGRWPHLHFEVFESVEAAISGDAALLTSQFALTEADCATVYAARPEYAASIAPLAATSLRRDRIFRDNSAEGLAAQMIVLTGNPVSGYQGEVAVGLN